MSAKVLSLALSTNYERKTRTKSDTIMVTPEMLDTWKSPPFQRPVRENDKVRALAEQLKLDGGVWPGVVTLGVLAGQTYIIDGQHRKAAFLISQLKEGYTDVRIHHFVDMASMGEEFVNLNSQLVRMRPDDILRGLESSIPGLQKIREECPFVAYDQLRRTPSAPVLSMAMVLRCWRISANECPGGNTGGNSAAQLAKSLSDGDAEALIAFLKIAMEAFGRDPEYYRLWGALNLTLCMWLYRKIVMYPAAHNPLAKAIRISRDQFKRCLMSLSANTHYLDWLVGRLLTDRDRSPAYSHIRESFARRLKQDMPSSTKVYMPQPAWASKSGGRGR